MKWTNHPRILEVCIVQSCQMSTSHSIPSEMVHRLEEKIASLERKFYALQEQGLQVHVKNDEAKKQQKAKRPSNHHFKVPTGKVENILANATKQQLQLVKQHWGAMIEKLKKSHAALLNDAEPVAASHQGCIVKFKYEIHCQMAMGNSEFVDVFNKLLQMFTKENMEIIGVPEHQWLEIRQSFIEQHRHLTAEGKKAEEDPLIAEAKKLFSEELLEIRD